MENICNVPSIIKLANWNFNIPVNILDAYYAQVPQPKNLDEVSKNYVGSLNHYNSPYQYCIYGAYPLKTYWEMLEYKIDHVNDESGYHKCYKRERVYEVLKSYAKGFQYGFDNFLADKINSKTLLSNTEQFKAQKIMDWLSSMPFKRSGFSELSGDDNDFENWENDGIEAGYEYCAWYLILENHKLFESFFNSLQPTENPLIFEKSILDNFHGAFNDYLWESTDIELCKNWFRVKPIGVPIFKKDMKFYFCYAIGKIEEKRNVQICPNMGKWITQLIGNTNHSSLKKKATDKTKKSVINEKFNLFT